MTVMINIEDINDNYPQFQSRDTVSVAEDEPKGYPLLVVAAKDGDKNSSVRYTITSGDPENRFTLNSFTGESVWVSVHPPSCLPTSLYLPACLYRCLLVL